MLTRRQVVKMVLDGEKPPYVPWSFKFTLEPKKQLQQHYGVIDLDDVLQNHLLNLGHDIGFFTSLGNEKYQDVFGVIWDRSIDKDIGNVCNCVLSEPSLQHYRFPDPEDERLFAEVNGEMAAKPDMFRVYQIGFSLFERAWTLRGMENLLMDFIDHPQFVHELLTAITDYNLQQIRKALTFDIDGIYFGDDWGQQRGLIMGRSLWREFIHPPLERMYRAVRDAGKYVFIHSCGDVDELFDDLVELGVHCFNPFQPEVMDVASLLPAYRGRLAFHGGLSMQRTLPYGTPAQVKQESERLLELGRSGGYIFSPSHSVEGDTPLANILAFITAAQRQ
jgi:uroporphyrinogen decarboxylase